jgi:hypothetical protein
MCHVDPLHHQVVLRAYLLLLHHFSALVSQGALLRAAAPRNHIGASFSRLVKERLVLAARGLKAQGARIQGRKLI